MPRDRATSGEESEPLNPAPTSQRHSDELSDRSISSISTTSLVLEHINESAANRTSRRDLDEKYRDEDSEGFRLDAHEESLDIEDGRFAVVQPVDKKARRLLWIVGIICVAGWGLALTFFLVGGSFKPASSRPHDPLAPVTKGSGKKVTLDSVLGGSWRPYKQDVTWIAGPEGEDGLLLERGVPDKEYLVVEDVRNIEGKRGGANRTVLMENRAFDVKGRLISPSQVWPSKDFSKVLVMSDEEKNWRHSYTGLFWIFDVATQKGEPLDPEKPDARIQLASWSPQSDAIVFTRDNNMFIRKLDSQKARQITDDGGSELFYGVPDWVYEEEVFKTNSATWWSEDGEYVAFIRTNESQVPTYPVQYFVSRPSGKKPKPGEESYPEVRDIKYPKAGAPNPVVAIQFYSVTKDDVFDIKISDDFADHDRLITEVVWAGRSKKVLVRETNRESDVLKVVLMDVERRTGRTVRTEDVQALDGGWFEVSQGTTFVPSDPQAGRNKDGYIDTIIHEGYDHLGYFTPMDNPKPIILTQGKWEVVDAPSAIDLKNNLVYYLSTERSSIERHAYVVKLDGTGKQQVMPESDSGYYDVHFSTSGGYALISYEGPGIPWQKIISTPHTSSKFSKTLETNPQLEKLVKTHELPILKYETVEVEGYTLNVLERRPPHFNPKHKYPVLFYQYSGPMSQTVDKKFHVDFQAYVASNLGYVVVTVDGRGTGFLGRKLRCAIRGHIGEYEAADQIAVAKMWAGKKYVDEERLAIWGWSYGGFTALKTLETDGGRTFKYGMAVAPVTDWRFYDSIYTERYMHTPQRNPTGYSNSSIHDTSSLSSNVRFLIMHGVADDNVHMQNTLTLLDKLDLAGVENYDVHVFPDSDHSIYFHGANRIVYDKLSSWLINAFNGEWLRIQDAVPKAWVEGKERRR
ncbi:putative dipeptidyl-aminopeptidase B [Sporormia fimetaria CBS 119925]|uniref:dipeptidyl-peptidase IV n=1 Tax=Sporormia fimetaria CBS 119925 TaxID=1340428 RepID=A0A6A6VLJ6_9PLEO|nr:putative dipeptidyl-aminopeptidase B [Sporormia fimetaria CBS 119925]